MSTTTTTEHFVCGRDELAPGEMRAFDVGRTRIVLCRTDESFAAVRDVCPHQGARLSGGRLGGTILPCDVGEYRFGRDKEVLRCPRHGYEFDVRSGRSLHDPERVRVRAYRVVERDDGIYVELDDR